MGLGDGVDDADDAIFMIKKYKIYNMLQIINIE
jgi:hypothetical protein